jgi:3-deoxy-D-manno-octulosonic-acid transferase
MFNFREVAAQSVEAGASRVCATHEELETAIRELLGSAEQRVEMGLRARELVQRNVGASARYAAVIAESLSS